MALITYELDKPGATIDELLEYVSTLRQKNSMPVGVKWDTTSSSPTLTTVDINKTEISTDTTFFDNHDIWGNIKRCTLTPEGVATYGTNARGDGLTLDGTAGNVMCRVPTGMAFSEIDGTDRYWWVAKLDSELTPWENTPAAYQRGGVLHDEIFVSAYEASGVLDTTFKLVSATGKTPVTGAVGYPDLPNTGRFTIDDAELYAGNIGSGWGCYSLHTHAWLQLLMYIEAGTFDTQTAFGRGVVDLAGGVDFAGLNTGADSIDANLAVNGTGAGIGTNGQTPIAWRGIENPWGNVWKYGIGYNAVDAEYRIANRDGSGILAGILTAGNYEASSAVPIVADGYFSNVESDPLLRDMFIPSAVAGSSSTQFCDYNYAHDIGETNILLLGGGWNYGSDAGVGCRASTSVSSNYVRNIGARLEFIPQ